MSVKTELNEIEGIVTRTTRTLLAFVQNSGRRGSELRLACGDLVANINRYMRDRTFARRLLNCFLSARTAGINLDGLDMVLRGLVNEKPTELGALAVVNNSIIFALAQQSRIIAATKYKSRDDVDLTMRRMKDWFDIARDLAANEMDSLSYFSLLDLAAATTRYLTDVARPLPRMVDFEVPPLPALAASQFIYSDGGRAEELTAENKVVHPAFCPRELRALSA